MTVSVQGVLGSPGSSLAAVNSAGLEPGVPRENRHPVNVYVDAAPIKKNIRPVIPPSVGLSPALLGHWVQTCIGSLAGPRRLWGIGSPNRLQGPFGPAFKGVDPTYAASVSFFSFLVSSSSYVIPFRHIS